MNLDNCIPAACIGENACCDDMSMDGKQTGSGQYKDKKDIYIGGIKNDNQRNPKSEKHS